MALSSATVAATVGTSVVPAVSSTLYSNVSTLKPSTVSPFTVKSLNVALADFTYSAITTSVIGLALYPSLAAYLTSYVPAAKPVISAPVASVQSSSPWSL